MVRRSIYGWRLTAAVFAGLAGAVLLNASGSSTGIGFEMPICSPAKAAEAPDLTAERPFLAENEAAMSKMMSDMDVKPSGDIDRDFVAMMRPHHQGAIDMAQAYLRYGRNEQLRRIAQEIVVEQGQEIAAMELALGNPAPPSQPAQTQSQPHQHGMHQQPTKEDR